MGGAIDLGQGEGQTTTTRRNSVSGSYSRLASSGCSQGDGSEHRHLSRFSTRCATSSTIQQQTCTRTWQPTQATQSSIGTSTYQCGGGDDTFTHYIENWMLYSSNITLYLFTQVVVTSSLHYIFVNNPLYTDFTSPRTSCRRYPDNSNLFSAHLHALMCDYDLASYICLIDPDVDA